MRTLQQFPVPPGQFANADRPRLPELHRQLGGVTDWYTLGVYLRLPTSDLKVIDEGRHGNQPRRCMMDMLEFWLGYEKNPSWLLVADAVRQMGHVVLAERITNSRQSSPGEEFIYYVFCTACYIGVSG